MKKSLVTFFFLFLFMGFFLDKAEAYSDSADHYSFDLPSGWEEIKKSVIDEVMNDTGQQANTKPVEFTAGFQLTGNEDFEYPYILIQEHKGNTPSFFQLEKAFNSDNLQERADRKTAKYAELLKKATTDKPFIDKERSIIFMNIQLDAVNGVEINGLIVMFLGKNGMTQLNFYSRKNEYSQWLPVFNSVIDSFRYDEGFSYNPVEAKKNDTPSIFEGVANEGIRGVILGGVLGLLGALIGWGVKKQKKKESDEINKDIITKRYCKECGNETTESATICDKCDKEILKNI
jgi:ribosomal protein L40E